jgi:putative transcriptional regulator
MTLSDAYTLIARVGGKKMTKRNLFAELTEGFDALASARKGKKTLRTTVVELKPAVEISADELRAIAKS